MHVCAPVTEHSSVRHFGGGPLMFEYECSNLLILTGFRHQRLLLTMYFSVCMIIRCGVVVILSLHIRAHDVHLSLNVHVGTYCRQQKGAATNYSVTKCVFALSLHLLPCLLSPHFQGKLLHMLAGMRMSWEAQSMNIVVAKASPNLCATGPRPSS